MHAHCLCGVISLERGFETTLTDVTPRTDNIRKDLDDHAANLASERLSDNALWRCATRQAFMVWVWVAAGQLAITVTVARYGTNRTCPTLSTGCTDTSYVPGASVTVE